MELPQNQLTEKEVAEMLGKKDLMYFLSEKNIHAAYQKEIAARDAEIKKLQDELQGLNPEPEK